MKPKTLLVSSLILGSTIAAAPALAALHPVTSHDLDRFIGSTIFGEAQAPLGVVSRVDVPNGVVSVVGRHGQLALLHTSVLARNGTRVRAPEVSIGEFNDASAINAVRPGSILVQPRIIIEEPPPAG